jgi:hypothetical protein
LIVRPKHPYVLLVYIISFQGQICGVAYFLLIGSSGWQLIFENEAAVGAGIGRLADGGFAVGTEEIELDAAGGAGGIVFGNGG